LLQELSQPQPTEEERSSSTEGKRSLWAGFRSRPLYTPPVAPTDWMVHWTLSFRGRRSP